MRAEPKHKKVTRIPTGRNTNIPSLARKSERKARKLRMHKLFVDGMVPITVIVVAGCIVKSGRFQNSSLRARLLMNGYLQRPFQIRPPHGSGLSLIEDGLLWWTERSGIM